MYTTVSNHYSFHFLSYFTPRDITKVLTPDNHLSKLHNMAFFKYSSGFPTARLKSKLTPNAERIILGNGNDSDEARKTTTAWRRTATTLKRRGKAASHYILIKFKLADVTSDDEATFTGDDVPMKALVKRGPDFSQRYPEIRCIASGANGVVHLHLDLKHGTLVAVKTVSDETYEPSEVPHEVQIIRHIGPHDNIIRCFAVYNDSDSESHKKIVFQYCSPGDLASYVDKFKVDVPEDFIWHAFKQIAHGLHHIHAASVVHGDLKMANVLLVPNPRDGLYPTLKIADFGASEFDWPSNIPFGHVGTWLYSPPEAEYHQGPEGDVWALGNILYFLARRTMPRRKLNEPEEDSELWFEQNEKRVPPGTPFKEQYKSFCLFLAKHPIEIKRVDKPSKYCFKARTKLLNYWMMRTLDLNWRTRINTVELQRFVCILEPYVRNVTAAKHRSLLNSFEDARGGNIEVTDASVFKELFSALAVRAIEWNDPALLGFGKELVSCLDAEDLVDAQAHLTQAEARFAAKRQETVKARWEDRAAKF